MAELKDANTNPWYVLMTLYGEQTDDLSFPERNALHEKNRRVWNAWACQNLTEEAAKSLAESAAVDFGETRAWAAIAADVVSRHAKVMTDRNGPDFAYPGLPAVEDFLDCSEIQFFNTVVLKNCIFTQAADFTEAKFTQAADFTEAKFTQAADFIEATFTQAAYFGEATFTQDADFTEAKFTQDAYFNRATFTQDAYFIEATFTQAAYFNRATFTQAANFRVATFTQAANFSGAVFSGFVRMQHATFGKADENGIRADFSDCQFEKPTSFRAAAFRSSYPILAGAVLHENTDFSASEGFWPKLQQINPKAARESCAKIRHAVDKQGLPEDAHFFFRREMQFAGQVGPWWAGLPYRLFGLVSDYGHSIARPAWSLVALWAVPALIYMIAFEWARLRQRVFLESYEAVGFSFANIFKFFGFQRTYFDLDLIQKLPAWIQVLSATQTVFGFILLFFLGLGLRTRFRMR